MRKCPRQKSPGAVPAPVARRKSPTGAPWLPCAHSAWRQGHEAGPASAGVSWLLCQAAPGRSPVPRAVPGADPAVTAGTHGRSRSPAQGKPCWPL